MTHGVDEMLARAGLPVSEEQMERLRRNYPIIEGWLEQLRGVPLHDAEPDMLYRLLPPTQR